MDKYRQLAELLKGRQTRSEVFFTATFVSSQGDTCTIKVDDLTLDGVRMLPTTTKSENKVLMTPMVGTDVLVGSLSGDFSNLFVMSANEVDNIEITCNGQNVMTLISDLIGSLSGTLVLTTSVGAATGNFDPGTIAKLKNIEMAFKQIFK